MTIITYDVHGDPVSTTEVPDEELSGSDISTAWQRWNAEPPTDGQYTHAYNSAGDLVMAIDRQGNVTTRTDNGVGQTKEAVPSDETGQLPPTSEALEHGVADSDPPGDPSSPVEDVPERVISFTYDSKGRLAEKSDGTNTWKFVWNADDRLAEVKLNGLTQVSYDYSPIQPADPTEQAADPTGGDSGEPEGEVLPEE